MSQQSTIEIYRPVIFEAGSQFEADVTSLARDLFDIAGNSLISVRPSNNTFRTVKSGMGVVPEDSMKFYHLNRYGENVKHFGNKIISVKDKLEDGPDVRIKMPSGLDMENRAGRESLAETFYQIATEEYDKDDFNDELTVKLTSFGIRRNDSKQPFETIFTLGFEPQIGKTDENMAFRMSEVAEFALKNIDDNERVVKAQSNGFVNNIPFARTRSTDTASLNSFERTVKEFLPISVRLGGLVIRAKT